MAAVPGVVTATSATGFWMQDPEPDADPATSEGIFVFRRNHGVQAGDAVEVAGDVTEFRPGGDADNLTTTEIAATAVTRRGTGAVAPVVVGAGGRRPPGRTIEDDANGDVERPGVRFDPRRDGLDFHESLEGMLVEIAAPQVVGPTSAFGELPVVARGTASPRTRRGGVAIRPADFNPERLILDDVLADTPAADVADELAGPVRAVVDYSFGSFKYLVTAAPAVVDGGLRPETTARPGASELAVASLNVENLDPADPPEKFARLADILVRNLRSPDLVAVEEVQDDNGPAPGGGAGAAATFAALTAAIAAARRPGRTPSARSTPSRAWTAASPAATSASASSSARTAASPSPTAPAGPPRPPPQVVAAPDGARLTLSPGRVDPANPAFADSRKPLAGEFRWRGRTVFAIANHFVSKGADQPLLGRVQPPERSSEVQRHAQAAVVGDFAAALLAADPGAAVVVLGDFNDFAFSRTLEILGGGGLRNLTETLPERERYSYVVRGQLAGARPHPRGRLRARGVRHRARQRRVRRRGVGPRPPGGPPAVLTPPVSRPSTLDAPQLRPLVGEVVELLSFPSPSTRITFMKPP